MITFLLESSFLLYKEVKEKDMIQKIDGHHINKFIENKTKPMNARASGRVISRLHRVKTEFFSV